MFGGPFIVIMDRTKDCMDMAWTDRLYTEGEPPADYDFAALQFAFELARDGTLVVEQVKANWVTGSFDVTFDQGTLSGSFQAEYCTNLKD